MHEYSGMLLLAPEAFDIPEKDGIAFVMICILTVGLIFLALAFTDKGGKGKK